MCSYNDCSQRISQLGDIAVQSVAKEMQQMCEKSVWEGVSMNSLTDTQKNKIISSSMFLKDRYHADGKFDKLKSRLVAGGHLQDRNVYDNGSSPTASTTSVFIIAAIAAVALHRTYMFVHRTFGLFSYISG